MALRRLRNEAKQIVDDIDGINRSTGGSIFIYKPSSSSSGPYDYECVMKGPDGSPYHGGVFVLSIQVSPNYPVRGPPKITFQNPIWHPNVDFASGTVHLFQHQQEWNIQWTIQAIMLMLYSALKDPLLDNSPSGFASVGVNIQASLAYREDRQDYINTAQQYTRRYAGSEPEEVTKPRTVQRLIQMGFPHPMAVAALERTMWNEDAAVTDLLEQLVGDEPSAVSSSSYSFVQEFSHLHLHEEMEGGGWVDISANSGAAAGGADSMV